MTTTKITTELVKQCHCKWSPSPIIHLLYQRKVISLYCISKYYSCHLIPNLFAKQIHAGKCLRKPCHSIVYVSQRNFTFAGIFLFYIMGLILFSATWTTVMLSVYHLRIYLNLPIRTSELKFNLFGWKFTCSNYIFIIIHFNSHCFI